MFLIFADLVIDPIDIVACFGIDTWVSRRATANSERNNTTVKSITGHWATRVTLQKIMFYFNLEYFRQTAKLMRLGLTNRIVEDSDFKPIDFDR